MSVFDPVDTSLKFPSLEAEVLAFWKANDIFHKSLKQRDGKPTWVFYEGPPTANGKPHPGHVLTRVVKDLFPRYKTMRGYRVPRKAGWDTHGLPVEVEVEKELKISGKNGIEEYGVERFVRKCIDSVFRYTDTWEELTQRIGFWIDLPEAYVTYHQSYVESVWWSLQQLFERKLLYQGNKILPWCPRCRTALSSAEVGQGYKDVEDPSVFVTFRDPEWEKNKTSFLAWTTTPWTLPSNAGLAVKADTEYSHVKVGEETLIMASTLVKSAMGKVTYEVVKAELGSALVGRRYQPLFDWWKGRDNQRAAAWKVCAADFVTLDTGAGIVHVAPAFGEDDYKLGQKEGLPTIQLVDAGGNFTSECGAFAGRFVKDADNDIVKDLRTRGLLLKREGYKHEYPFCWRCDSPLIYFARECWFIRTTQEIGHVIENNKTVHWIPEHIRDGRFGNFLESNVDWALSRERYWGTPLPIWKCPGCHYQEAVGSLEELRKKEGVIGLDVFDKAKAADPTLNEHLRIHKPWIDAVEYDCPICSLRLKRVPEVIDCWYDSGAMPYAQWGYPHVPGSKEQFAEAFPADFISEAIDQTRGWFYSLIAESTLLGESFGKASGVKKSYPHPYKTCVVLGHVCDEKGEKMSKSKGNYLDPTDILNEEGADALRWFFYSCNHPWTSARFSRGAVRESQKEFLIKLWNVYSFFAIYANLDGFDPKSGKGGGFRGGRPLSSRAEMDRWILSELHRTVKDIRTQLDEYSIFDAAAALSAFADCLSNWYVQRSRDRYWRSWKSADRSAPDDQDKLDCYWTLYECLVTTAQLMAPFVPFMAEAMWRNLAVKPLGGAVPESVHLCDYPEVDATAVDEKLSAEMALIREIVSLGRNVRSLQKLKVRLPLPQVIIVLADPSKTEVVKRHEDVLLDALNVKKVDYAAGAEQFVNYALKPNFKAIGAKHRERVPAIKKALAEADAAKLRVELDESGVCTIDAGGHPVKLSTDEVEVTLSAKEGYAAASGRQEVVVLDTHVTPALQEEGFARELVFRVNGFRGDLNLKYEQRIKLTVKGSAKLEDVARKFQSYICGETLATELRTGETPADWTTIEIDVEGEKGVLAMQADRC
jgi:isoleucyl-tRNA synthetase